MTLAPHPRVTLAIDDHAPDIPVKQDQRGIRRKQNSGRQSMPKLKRNIGRDIRDGLYNELATQPSTAE